MTHPVKGRGTPGFSFLMTHPFKGREPPGKFAFLMTHPVKGRGGARIRLSDDPPSQGEGAAGEIRLSETLVRQILPRSLLRFPLMPSRSTPVPNSHWGMLRRASLRGPPGFRAPPGLPPRSAGLPSSARSQWSRGILRRASQMREPEKGRAQPPEGEPHCRKPRHYPINVGSGCQPGPRPHPDERPPAHNNLSTPDRT